MLRDAENQSPEQQQALICELLNGNAWEIQESWQTYLMNQELSSKWSSLSDNYADAMTRLPSLSFQTTDMQAYATAMEKWNFASKEISPIMNGPMHQTTEGGKKVMNTGKGGQ